MRLLSRKAIPTAMLILFAAMPGAVSADPVVVTSGYTEVELNLGLLRGELIGDGFRMTFSGDGFESDVAFQCSPCTPGDTVALSGRFNVPRLSGSAQVDGVTYPTIYFDGMEGIFSSPSFVIDGTSTVTLTQPFTFSGMVSGYLLDPFIHGFTTPEFTRTLFGSGTASATFLFVGPAAGGPLFDATDLRYDFEAVGPVPEPATLLLTVAGLAGAVRARRRSRGISTHQPSTIASR